MLWKGMRRIQKNVYQTSKVHDGYNYEARLNHHRKTIDKAQQLSSSRMKVSPPSPTHNKDDLNRSLHI